MVDQPNLETTLIKINEWLKDMERLMVKVAEKRKTSKRPRIDPSQEISLVRFNDGLAALKREWLNLLKDLFHLPVDTDTYEFLAKDILSRFHKTKIKYNLNDEHYNKVWGAVIRPLLLLIMDELNISREVEQVQDRRKLLLQLLMAHELTKDLIIKSTDEPCIESTPSDEEINPCDDSPPNCRHEPIDTFHNSCSHESIIVLQHIVSTFETFTSLINDQDSDWSYQIYHIVNITHIMDVVRGKLAEIKTDLETENEKNCRTPVKPILIDTMKEVENDLRRIMDSYESTHPLTIFTDDLNGLLIRVRVIVHIMSIPRG